MPLRALPPEDSVSAISPLGQKSTIKIQNCSAQINISVNLREPIPMVFRRVYATQLTENRAHLIIFVLKQRFCIFVIAGAVVEELLTE